MGFWDKLRRDIKKGVDEGLNAFKEGTTAIKERAGTITDDLKKRVKVFELKQKIQVHLTDLGGRVYELSSDKRKNPLADVKVKGIVDKIKKIENQISKLEAKIVKKATRAVKTTKKTAKKTARKATKKLTVKKASPKKGIISKRRIKKK